MSAPLTKAQGNSVDVTWDEIIQMNPIHRSVVCPIEMERINGRAGQFDGHPCHLTTFLAIIRHAHFPFPRAFVGSAQQ